MKKTLIVLLSGCFALPLPAIAQNNTEQLDQEARTIAKQFLGQLKPELQKSMKADGPAKTIDFCRQEFELKMTSFEKDPSSKTTLFWKRNDRSAFPEDAVLSLPC